MGHSTTRAAMVYLHGSDKRQQAIADALSEQAEVELGRSKKRRSGTAAAERTVSADHYPRYTCVEVGVSLVRRAGFEPATRCLEGTSEASRYVARHRSARH